MSSREHLMNLVKLVNDQLKKGTAETEIVGFLISAGLDERQAQQVVETVKASRVSHLSGMVRFIVVSLLAVSIFTFSVYTTVGEGQFVAQARIYTAAFFVCSIIFGVLASIKGKVALYARLINAAFWFGSAFTLMCAMFMHPGWESRWLGTGGGWRGQLVTFAGNIIYNIGAMGIAYILVFVSLVILLFLWAEFHRLKTQDYAAI